MEWMNGNELSHTIEGLTWQLSIWCQWWWMGKWALWRFYQLFIFKNFSMKLNETWVMGHGVEVLFHGLTLRFNMFVWIVICSCGGQWAARALIGALQWQQQCLCYDIVWKYGPSPAQRRAQTSRNTAKEISTPARPSHWWEAAPCRPSSYYGVKTVMSCPVSSVMYTHIVLWRLGTLHAPIQTSMWI